MAVKKEKEPLEELRNLLIKLRNVYSDVYIYKRKYCLPGINTEEDSLGTILCTLTEKYENLLENLKVPDVFYIESIADVKDGMKVGNFNPSYLEETHVLEPMVVEEKLIEDISVMEDVFLSEENIWVPISSKSELLEHMFDYHKIYNNIVETKNGEKGFVTLAKQMFPILTKKNAEKGFICIKEVENESSDGLFQILYDFEFEYFRQQAQYWALLSPIDEE